MDAAISLPFVDEPLNAADIAVVHTVFNLFSTALLLPFSRGLEKLACLTIREKDAAVEEPVLDERFLNTPAFALEQCKSAAVRMAELSRETLLEAMTLLEDYQEKKAAEVAAKENQIDRYEDRLGTFLVQLSSRELMPQGTATRYPSCCIRIGRLGTHRGSRGQSVWTRLREKKEKGLSVFRLR